MTLTPSTCCDMMALHVAWRCEVHSDPFDCPDALILKAESIYGLIVHDGGRSIVQISHCL